jgi:hypothetical protein
MHRVWHMFVLVTALLGVASAALLAIVPLAMPQPPEGFARLKPWLMGLVALGVCLVALEWVGIH